MEEIVFPNQIRINRKMRGVSMQDLADRLGISLSAISKIEKGYRRLNQEQLILVAEVLDCSLQDLYVNEQNSQHEVVMAWKKEQERRQEINKSSGLKVLGAALRYIRNEKSLTLIEVAENADMTLSVYHRIEMGQREVSDKEFKNIAKALAMQPEELKEEIKSLDDKGMLEEIIQRNDAKYKLLSTPRGAIASFGGNLLESTQISVFGTAGKNGNVIIDPEEEIKKVPCPVSLQNKKDAYALNLCTRRLGNLLPARSVLFVDPQEPVSVGDIAVYYISDIEAEIISVREDESGQLYGIRWNPDEKVTLGNDDLQRLQRVVFISL